jgi:hypothetical protein
MVRDTTDDVEVPRSRPAPLLGSRLDRDLIPDTSPVFSGDIRCDQGAAAGISKRLKIPGADREAVGDERLPDLTWVYGEHTETLSRLLVHPTDGVGVCDALDAWDRAKLIDVGHGKARATEYRWRHE